MPTKILVLNSGKSGCDWYRTILPTRELARHGFEVKMPEQVQVGPAREVSKMPADEDLDWADLIVCRALSYPSIGPLWDRWLAFAPIIYDLDDDVFNLTTDNPALSTYLYPGATESIRRMLSTAALVTCPTQPLAARLAEQGARRVAVLPNCVDFSALVDWHSLGDRWNDGTTVGWSGSIHHSLDWLANARPIRNWLLAHPEVDFHLIGADYRPTLEIPWARWTDWAPPDRFLQSLDFDIGLAPLALNLFNQAKSPIKAVEYGARGIVTVATGGGTPYDDYLLDGETGFLVREPDDWGRALDTLLSRPSATGVMAFNAREQAADWTIQNNWERWADEYQQLA